MNKIDDFKTTGEKPTQTDLVRELAEKALTVLAESTGASEAWVASRLVKLSDAFLSNDPEDAKRVMDKVLARGFSVDETIDLVLPEVARNLGDRWFADDISFVDVSIGTARLQETVRELRARDVKSRLPVADDARVLLVIPSPEEHTLGVFIAADQLRRHGLIVELSVAERRNDLMKRLQSRHYRMIGITASGVRSLASVREIVTTIRRYSQGFVPIALGGAVKEMEQSRLQNLPIDLIGTDITAAARRFGLLEAQKDTGA